MCVLETTPTVLHRVRCLLRESPTFHGATSPEFALSVALELNIWRVPLQETLEIDGNAGLKHKTNKSKHNKQ